MSNPLLGNRSGENIFNTMLTNDVVPSHKDEGK
jgi:hypothetical protein